MKTRHLTLKIVPLVLAVVCIFSITGVAATWTYATGDVATVTEDFSVVLNEFDYPVTTNEQEVANNLLAALNGTGVTDEEKANAEIINDAIDARSGMAYVNELAATDPRYADLKDALGLDDGNTAVIRYTGEDPAYELFTSSADFDAMDRSIFENENYYIYPVNRTSFKEDADGNLVVDKVETGYARPIWYYQNYNTQYDGNGRAEIRVFDVSQWGIGSAPSRNNAEAIGLDVNITNNTSKIFTVSNTEETKILWFGMGPDYNGANAGNGGGYYITFTPGAGCTITLQNDDGTVLGTAMGTQTIKQYISGGTAYYLKIEYSGAAEDFNFTIQRTRN